MVELDWDWTPRCRCYSREEVKEWEFEAFENALLKGIKEATQQGIVLAATKYCEAKQPDATVKCPNPDQDDHKYCVEKCNVPFYFRLLIIEGQTTQEVLG